MKKKIALLLLTTMAISLVGCGEKDTTENNDTVVEDSIVDDTTDNTDDTDSTDDVVSTEGAEGVLNAIWATYEEENMFAAGGGDSQNMVMDGPGKFDATNTEELDVTLGFPTDYVDKIDDAASLMHMMNANTFTSGVYHVTNADDVSAVCDALKENIMNRQWMCGFPETLIIVTVDDNYVISAFGNGQIIETFKNKISGVYDNATVVYEESL
jgi:hypothetical protein